MNQYKITLTLPDNTKTETIIKGSLDEANKVIQALKDLLQNKYKEITMESL